MNTFSLNDLPELAHAAVERALAARQAGTELSAEQADQVGGAMLPVFTGREPQAPGPTLPGPGPQLPGPFLPGGLPWAGGIYYPRPQPGQFPQL